MIHNPFQSQEEAINQHLQGTQSDDEDEGIDGLRFTYEWTKWMRPDQIEPYLTRFTCAKIPRGSFERSFVYYKKYPKDFQAEDPEINQAFKSIYREASKLTNAGKTTKQISRLDLNLRARQESQKKKGIEVKTFANPYNAPKEVSKKKQFGQVSRKIVDDLPENRSMLVVNFDEEFSADYVKSVFGCMGKIRRVFKGTLKKRKRTKSG